MGCLKQAKKSVTYYLNGPYMKLVVDINYRWHVLLKLLITRSIFYCIHVTDCRQNLQVALCRRKSTRLTAVVGGLVMALALLFASFARHYHQIFLRYNSTDFSKHFFKSCLALGECQQFFKPPSVTFFMFYLIIEQRRADHIGLLFVSRGPKYADSILKMEPSRAECWPILSKKVSKCYFLPLSWEIILLLIIAHIKMKFVMAKM